MASDYREIANDPFLRRCVGEVTGIDPVTGEFLDEDSIYFDDEDSIFFEDEDED